MSKKYRAEFTPKQLREAEEGLAFAIRAMDVLAMEQMDDAEMAAPFEKSMKRLEKLARILQVDVWAKP